MEWCGLLWCFYQLFGLSFWRHPFTAEDPLVNKWRCKFHTPYVQMFSNILSQYLSICMLTSLPPNIWIDAPKPCSMSAVVMVYAATQCMSHMISATQHMSVSCYDCEKHPSKKTVMPVRVWSQVGVLHVPLSFPGDARVWERERGKLLNWKIHWRCIAHKLVKTVSLCKPASHYTDKEGNSLSIACSSKTHVTLHRSLLRQVCIINVQYHDRKQAPSRIWPTATSGFLPFNPTLTWSHATGSILLK